MPTISSTGSNPPYDYNPAPQLDKIKAKLLAVNFADDELNPPELGVMEREVPRSRMDVLCSFPPATKPADINR